MRGCCLVNVEAHALFAHRLDHHVDMRMRLVGVENPSLEDRITDVRPLPPGLGDVSDASRRKPLHSGAPTHFDTLEPRRLGAGAQSCLCTAHFNSLLETNVHYERIDFCPQCEVRFDSRSGQIGCAVALIRKHPGRIRVLTPPQPRLNALDSRSQEKAILNLHWSAPSNCGSTRLF